MPFRSTFLACHSACLTIFAATLCAVAEEPLPAREFRTRDDAWRAIERHIALEDAAALERQLDADPTLVATFAVFRGKGEVRHETLLHYAAGHGKLTSIKLLLARGANVDAKSVHWRDHPLADSGQTPLHYAVRFRNLEVIRFLLDSGAEVNARTKGGATPLHEAMWKCRPEIAKLLMGRGADIDAKTELGWTVLHSALFSAPREVADLIAARGAKQDIFSAAGLGNIRLMELLVQEAPDLVNARTGDRETPLHFAAATGEVAAAEFLMKRGAAIGAQNGGLWSSPGESPLHVAASRGHLSMCRRLVESGAELDMYGNGRTPLHSAINENHLDVVEYLVTQGADIHRRDLIDGHTALHVAATGEQTDIARFLLDHGAHVNCRAVRGPGAFMVPNYYTTRDTPLDIAVNRRHFLMARFLQSRGGRFSAVEDDSRKAYEQWQVVEKPGS
jgi:ankyrin repeat protein